MRKFRLKYNYTQQQLADLMKVSRSSLSYWELGKRKPRLKDKLKISLFFIKFYFLLTFNKIVVFFR
jgi:transcriptional regulator with XRE-family HTH domain